LFPVHQSAPAFGGRPPGRRDRGCPGFHRHCFVRHADWIM